MQVVIVNVDLSTHKDFLIEFKRFKKELGADGKGFMAWIKQAF